MVPLQNQHGAQGIIEGDRMLLMSGSLVSSFGQASSVLFDGSNFIPYMVSASASGSPGSMAGLFNSLANFSFSQHSKSTEYFLDFDENDTLHQQISSPLALSS
jgi:Cortical protein marker for cell polarity